VTSRNNRRGVAGGVLCGSAPRLYVSTDRILFNVYAGNKQKLYGIIRTNTSAVLDKAKPDMVNISGLNLEAVKLTTVQVTMPAVVA
jgi:hypothetical protein